MVYTATKPSGSGSDRALSMAFDGETPQRQAWFDSGHEFLIFDHDPGFLDVIARLRTHRQVEFIATDHTGDIWRATFTLNGAAAIIEQAFQACGKKHREMTLAVPRPACAPRQSGCAKQKRPRLSSRPFSFEDRRPIS